MSSPFLIYALTDPRTSQVRYIGKSSTGLKRPLSHASPKKLNRDQSHKGNWIRSLQAVGLRYGVRVLQEIEIEEEVPEPRRREMLNTLEREWIAFGKAQGWPLTNLTDGGDGLSGCPEELRERLRQQSTGRKHTEEAKEKVRRARIGKPRTEKEKQAISEACRRPEAIEKMRAANLGKKKSEEHRRALSEAHKGYHPSAETRAKMSAAQLGKKRSPETCARISASKKGKARPDVSLRRRSEDARAQLAKLQEMARGRARPDLAKRNSSQEHREAVSRALKGRVFSEETLAKMRASQQARQARARAEQEAKEQAVDASPAE